MLSQFETDTIKILRSNGEVIENIKAGIQAKMILVSNTKVPIQSGDTITIVILCIFFKQNRRMEK